MLWQRHRPGAGVGGRPKALRGHRLEHAPQLASAGVAVPDIAEVLRAARSTVYRALNVDNMSEIEMADSPIDRVWSIRDAVPKWLHVQAMVDHDGHTVLDARDIATTVDWQGDPLTQPEVEQASDWLLGEGYLRGSSSWGHGVGRPSVTARGDA